MAGDSMKETRVIPAFLLSGSAPLCTLLSSAWGVEPCFRVSEKPYGRDDRGTKQEALTHWTSDSRAIFSQNGTAVCL